MNETNKIDVAQLQTKVKTLEDDVSALWKKWDWLQNMFIGIFVGIILNLIAVIGILILVKYNNG